MKYIAILFLAFLTACDSLRVVRYVEEPGEQVFVKSWVYLEAPVIDCEDHANYLYWQLVEEGKQPQFVYLKARKVHDTDHVLIELDGKWIDHFKGVNREVSKREYLRYYDILLKFKHDDRVDKVLGLEWHLHLLQEMAYRM